MLYISYNVWFYITFIRHIFFKTVKAFHFGNISKYFHNVFFYNFCTLFLKHIHLTDYVVFYWTTLRLNLVKKTFSFFRDFPQFFFRFFFLWHINFISKISNIKIPFLLSSLANRDLKITK